jgi:cell division transport system permease protein
MKAHLTRALDELRRRPMSRLLTVGAMAVSLTVVALFSMVAANVAHLRNVWGSGANLTVYLQDDVAPDRANEIALALGRLPAVADARVVDPAEAYDRLRRALGDQGNALDGLDQSFLPQSIEVSLHGTADDILSVSPLVARLKTMDGVADVEMAGDYARKIAGLLTFADVGALLLALVVLGATLYVVATTTRLGAMAHRDELDLLGLVGATPRYMAVPYLLSGAFEGLCAAALAATLAYVTFRTARPHVEAVLDFALRGQSLVFARPLEVLLWLVAGLLVGFGGSALALTRMTRETA